MKKTLFSVAIIGAGLVLAGCGSQNAPANDSAQKQESVKSTDGSAIGSIKDAMGLGTKMKCEYSMKAGEGEPIKSTAYIEGKKFRQEGSFNSVVQNVIFDGETMYSWPEGQTTGFKMTMACINELKATMPGQQDAPASNIPSPEDRFKDATNTSCSPTTENVDFSIPSTVTFNDQCEMMKKAIGAMSGANIPAGVPAGVPANIPNMPPMPGR